jgi:hypothetical protein
MVRRCAALMAMLQRVVIMVVAELIMAAIVEELIITIITIAAVKWQVRLWQAR